MYRVCSALEHLVYRRFIKYNYYYYYYYYVSINVPHCAPIPSFQGRRHTYYVDVITSSHSPITYTHWAIPSLWHLPLCSSCCAAWWSHPLLSPRVRGSLGGAVPLPCATACTRVSSRGAPVWPASASAAKSAVRTATLRMYDLWPSLLMMHVWKRRLLYSIELWVV